MASDAVRVKAMAIIWRGPEILVSKSDDGDGAYYRPLECLWVNPAELSGVPLYPAGLQSLLEGLGQ